MYLKHTEVLPIEPEEEGQKQQCKYIVGGRK